MATPVYQLFDVYGIEMEYMLVDSETLDVRPVADQVLSKLSGVAESGDSEHGPITWSNELARHVIELKTTRPTRSMRRLPNHFETAIDEIRPVLNELGLRLLPTAVHPWMNPASEAELWPYEYSDVYQTYDRVFNCRSHGWANVQSVHLNLPFSGDDEFAQLHAAVRILLPLLPALACSSPVLEGRFTGSQCTRMKLYSEHCQQIPVMTGNLIPEPIFDEATYRREIFGAIRSAVAPFDTEKVMQVEFMNARGAIARFDRGSIELRVMDVQEYPSADVAICAGVSAVLRAMCHGKWSDLAMQKEMPSADLRSLLDATSIEGDRAVISDGKFLKHFGVRENSITAGELWTKVLYELRPEDKQLDSLFAPLEIILTTGTLARRIESALGKDFTPQRLHGVYGELADCLVQWQSFQP